MSYKATKYIGNEPVDVIIAGISRRINPGDLIAEVPEWESKIKSYFEPVYDDVKDDTETKIKYKKVKE